MKRVWLTASLLTTSLSASGCWLGDNFDTVGRDASLVPDAGVTDQGTSSDGGKNIPDLGPTSACPAATFAWQESNLTFSVAAASSIVASHSGQSTMFVFGGCSSTPLDKCAQSNDVWAVTRDYTSTNGFGEAAFSTIQGEVFSIALPTPTGIDVFGSIAMAHETLYSLDSGPPMSVNRAPWQTRTAAMGTVAADSTLYAAGGIEQMTPKTDVLSLTNDAWVPVTPSLSIARSRGALVADASGVLWAMGGYTTLDLPSSLTDSVERIAIGAPMSASYAPLPVKLGDFGAVLAPDQRIYVLGGGTTAIGATSTPVGNAYVACNSGWAPAGTFTPRSAVTALVGPDNRIYVFGGVTQQNNVSGLVAVYGPELLVTQQSGNMITVSLTAQSKPFPAKTSFKIVSDDQTSQFVGQTDAQGNLPTNIELSPSKKNLGFTLTDEATQYPLRFYSPP